MDNLHPKRQKDKYNKYILERYDNEYYISFIDGAKNQQRVSVSRELYEVFDGFEREDLSVINEKRRHYDSTDIEEAIILSSLESDFSIEEKIVRDFRYLRLYEAISTLPDIQRRRLVMYYFDNMTLENIAKQERCTYQAIQHSISKSLKNLEKIMK